MLLRHNKFVGYVFLFFMIGAGFLPSISPQDLSSARQELSEVRKEIDRLQKELARSENTLQSQVNYLNNLDKQVSLYRQALRLLQAEIRKSHQEISRLTTQIDTLTNQITRLQKKFAQQVLFSYKYHRGRELDWILGADNFNQAYLRYRYFRMISQNVQHVYQRLRNKKNELESLKESRERVLRRQQQLAREKEEQQHKFLKRRAELQQKIKQITQDRQLLALALKEREKSLKKLEKIIAVLEKERQERKNTPQENVDWESIPGNFAQLRGQLNWPVKGKLLHGFGRYRNPQLKTVLLNYGIDIKAKKGSPVHCVAPGIVSTITYVAGFGKTVIVTHNKGYYTVYSHLDEVLVRKFEKVEAGKIIGTVGDSGSLEGSKLYFAIFGNNKPLNPLQWLKKI